ncbi:RDD family protein [Gordonia sp. NB41Y]|uniref:RDD family protein n=1 Tax=Gordonia sp. NB41Y TaxID=875808 RepID=UPI0006B1B2D3|nr:RDD family protein [Gordonia sp. NB41Y]KOY49752.1 transporter [Gordonia sp. NB41Y]WLP91917.1 RDD family protein [Gordonia sp. NB41Y]
MAEPRHVPSEHHAAHHVPPRDTDRTAGVVSRVMAGFIDLLVVVTIMTMFYLGALLARLIIQVHAFTLPNVNYFFTAGGFIGISVVYLTSCWAVSGRTLGDVVMGLRLVSRKGKPRVRFPVALLRALLCVFFSVGLLWVAVDRRRRSVADLIVRTRVVYSR